jgi:peroxiredoxin
MVLDSTASSGMYKLVYAIPEEEYNFDIIYNAKEDVEFKFNTETGISYQKSIENQLVTSYTKSMSLISQDIGNYFVEDSNDSLVLKDIFKNQRKTQSKFETDAKGTIAYHFIKANKPYIPKKYETYDEYINNLKIHFFDHVNFNDTILQSSNFLIERTLNYVFGITTEDKDEASNYITNIDEVNKALKSAKPIIKQKILEVLWQQMADAGYDSVANHISDKYLGQIAKQLNNTELLNRMALFKSLSIGNKAPDFTLRIKQGEEFVSKQLSEIDLAENYIVLFWSSMCSHCLDEIPQLQSHVKKLPKGKIKVIAIGLEDVAENWKKEAIKYPEFLHVLGLNKWENKIAKSYNVKATPTYFLLNKDKKIIAKPFDFEVLEATLSVKL